MWHVETFASILVHIWYLRVSVWYLLITSSFTLYFSHNIYKIDFSRRMFASAKCLPGSCTSFPWRASIVLFETRYCVVTCIGRGFVLWFALLFKCHLSFRRRLSLQVWELHSFGLFRNKYCKETETHPEKRSSNTHESVPHYKIQSLCPNPRISACLLNENMNFYKKILKWL